jgi:NAD(P)H-nitrite reductase large subunit
MSRQPKKGAARERVVCFCYNVNESTIIEAIRGGCTSVQDVRRTTYASTGCAGCSEEVKKLLRKYAAPEDDAPAAEGTDEDPEKDSNG